MYYQVCRRFVQQISSLWKSEPVFVHIRSTNIDMWKAALAPPPGLQLNVGKSTVYYSYSPFRPETLRVSLHAIPENSLHQAMDTQGLHFGRASNKRVAQQQLNNYINL